jgi:hypothetical protein
MTVGTTRDKSGQSTPDQGLAMTEERKTMTVPEAGRQYFGLARNASYDAAKRGDIPVIKIGSRLRVPVAALERMLAEAGAKAAG